MLAYHCIFGTYGFWLPNDPRGSGSDYVASWELFRFGQPTKTASRQSVAHRPSRPAWQRAARQSLHFAPVEFTGIQARLAVRGFAVACKESGYQVHACAVLPRHVHLVIGRHQFPVRRVVGHFKRDATLELKRAGHWSNSQQPIWGDHGWNVYLDEPADVRRAIRYVEENPTKEGKRPQRWAFVVPFQPRGRSASASDAANC